MLEASLRQNVERATGRRVDGAPITALVQNASNRSYYRVGVAPDSWVVMVMPPDAALKSEEVTQGGTPRELPFLDVHRYLEKLGIRVPKVHAWTPAEGRMVLEDLSDQTFEKALETQPREVLYRRAVELLATLRARAEAAPDPKCIAFSRKFDHALYDWELHHFREWGLEAWSGKKPTDAERSELDRHFNAIAARLVAAPVGFTHRDYQSRNLMLKGGELVVIDFQDALQGPRQYDLVALLRDSYVELERPLVEHLVGEYIAAFERETKERIEPRAFLQYFDLLTVQRKLKDAGRFEFINRVKGNPGFLPSIPASLRYVRDAFARQPDLEPLRRLCAKYVPELS